MSKIFKPSLLMKIIATSTEYNVHANIFRCKFCKWEKLVEAILHMRQKSKVKTKNENFELTFSYLQIQALRYLCEYLYMHFETEYKYIFLYECISSLKVSRRRETRR